MYFPAGFGEEIVLWFLAYFELKFLIHGLRLQVWKCLSGLFVSSLLRLVLC
jgi:hypothetical protein